MRKQKRGKTGRQPGRFDDPLQPSCLDFLLGKVLRSIGAVHSCLTGYHGDVEGSRYEVEAGGAMQQQCEHLRALQPPARCNYRLRFVSCGCMSDKAQVVSRPASKTDGNAVQALKRERARLSNYSESDVALTIETSTAQPLSPPHAHLDRENRCEGYEHELDAAMQANSAAQLLAEQCLCSVPMRVKLLITKTLYFFK